MLAGLQMCIHLSTIIEDGSLHMQVGVDLALQADPTAVEAKSRQLGALFQALMEPLCTRWGFKLASPARPVERGAQLCYAHPKGYAIVQVRAP